MMMMTTMMMVMVLVLVVIMAVDDLQSGVSDVYHRAELTSIPSPVNFLSTAHYCHVQVRRQQVPAKNQLSHVHGE